MCRDNLSRIKEGSRRAVGRGKMRDGVLRLDHPGQRERVTEG